MIEALRFALICFRLYRSHQRSADRSGLAKFTRTTLGVVDVALILGTGREAWRLADMATNYFASRGLNPK